MQSAKQIFRGADADGDRSVDADEFYAYMAEQATQSEKDTMQVGPEVGPTSAFYGCIPFGMHGPTCIFWANLTPFSLKHLLRVPDYLWVVEDGTLKSF